MGKGVKRKNRKIKQSSKGNKLLWEGGLFLITIFSAAGAAFLYNKTPQELAAVTILAGAGFGCVLFVLEQSLEEQSLLYDNASHLLRLTLIYLMALSGSLLFPLLPAGGWPYLAVFVALMLFGNRTTGISAGALLLMLTVLLKGTDSSTFFIYFIAGLVSVLVFSRVDDAFQIWLPTVISLLIQMVCLCIREVLLSDAPLTLQMFIIPVLNLVVCFILLMILLKLLSVSIIHKDRDLYMDINDPEYPLLVQLKELSEAEYYHAVHTAYLCDRAARRLNLNEAVVKACGYYHRIGLLKGENNWKNIREILNENHFPQEIQGILKEYIREEPRLKSPEAVVLLFCDTVISSISYLFSKDPEIDLDFESVIHAVFKKKAESGIIDESNITLHQLQEIEHILVEEQLYYDFLR